MDIMISPTQVLALLRIPPVGQALATMSDCLSKFQITPTELSAWLKDVKRQRLEQFEREKARMGEKQGAIQRTLVGTVDTRRVLTPDGWQVGPSATNANVVDENARPMTDAELQAEATIQGEVAVDIAEHEIGVAVGDLRSFVVARRLLTNKEGAGQWMDLLPVHDLLSVQNRVNKTLIDAEYKRGVLDGLAIADASGKP